jgi:putative ABC transport system substrate-binding protein
MQQFGHIEGKDYEVEAHFTSGSAELTEQIARKLAQEPVDVLVVITTAAVRIAREATHTIPIVMEASNALADGLVPSLSHPGGNLTGVSLLVSDLVGKRLELLREFRPNLHAVAFLGAARASSTATFVHETQTAADRLGVALSVRLVDGPAVIDQTLFDAIKKDGNEAVIVSALFLGQEDRIVADTMSHRRAKIFPAEKALNRTDEMPLSPACCRYPATSCVTFLQVRSSGLQ